MAQHSYRAERDPHGDQPCGAAATQGPGPRLFTTNRPSLLLEILCTGGLNGDNARLTAPRSGHIFSRATGGSFVPYGKYAY